MKEKINDKDMEKVTGGVVASGGIHPWNGTSAFIGGPDGPAQGIPLGMIDTQDLNAYDPHDEQIL